ncbi:hypothetical protein TD95_002686 [Thielaviopsis punctulata]|uniref:Alpha-1,2-mannosyltransferase n=1 Tax=Thielaviopsis punctulata TaxID=72032 RepID=A0A0F4ZHR0_9PEZI|nr:hypothetical protein TD95_002686 [Thielaviopsis punctulata]
MKSFWKQTRAALRDHGPTCKEIKGYGPPSEDDIEPKIPGDRLLPNLIDDYEDSEFAKLKAAHTGFLKAARSIAPKLPYVAKSRGVVMSGGGKYFGHSLTSITLMRKAGCDLPVELFINDHDDYDTKMCDEILPSLNAECVVMTDILGTDKVEKYQYKVLSILFSSFQELLFLDADAWPVRDISPVFDNEPFLSTGLIVWPDFWHPTVWPGFYDLIDQPVTNFTGRRSSESGMILYNKAIHADSLLLATYYNWYGPNYFYNMFSQGAPGEGDKETFRQAAIALSKPYWDVRSPNKVMGRWFNGTFESYGIKQMDPIADYKLAEFKRGGGVLEKNSKGEEIWAPPLFVHHNLWKMDLLKIPTMDDPMLRKDPKGRQMRLWDVDHDLIERTGFDVEDFMWKTIIDNNCYESFRKECAALRTYYRNVFEKEP